MIDIRKEAAFEATIAAHLVSPEGGYHPGDPKSYDPHLALIPDELLAYIQTTQPKIWASLSKIHGASLPAKLLAAFDQATAESGLLHVLRRGFPFVNKTIRVVTFRPPNGLNPSVQAAYDANRLLVVRQVHHDPKDPDLSLDLVLFVNGIPVVTAELKNQLTGQRSRHAQSQYKHTRSPDAPIFRFKRRALINFALDTDVVYMTSRLEGDQTRFWPFNRGIGTAAGNPVVPGKHRTSYLWEQIWQRDSLLDLLARFIHLEVDLETKRESMIFPRYHQLDCVRELEAEARGHGAGHNYLVQHSAGSGKSNTIAWLAHRLAALCDDQDRKVFDCVVVITDRKILDQQLQDTIFQLDHTRGVVRKIEKNSAELAQALTEGVPIIITTLQKFGFVADKVERLPDRRYAIIVDEAHSSQTGDMRNNLKQLLADSSALAREAEQLGEEEDVDASQDVLRAALARGPRSNLSFFAFTATPKYKTLQVFGHKGEDGRPAAFHVYSMRQAIEEKFILDVLQGYTTYQRFFQLIKLVDDDPQLDKRQATKALARFVNAHPKDVDSKIEIIVEHFHEHVRPLLGGRAKGMVVTATRLQAVQFRLAFDKYVQAKGYPLRALVAFTGEVEDPDDPASKERPYTEPGMNISYRTGKPISEAGLAKEFKQDGYHLLIVANKYQTGFDQPLLCAMYVNKRLAGVQAVQTLSRLNRTHPGKDTTFVLDFVNDRDHIHRCFADYYERTTADDDLDPQRLYSLRNELERFDVLRKDEIDAFAELVLRPKREHVTEDSGRLNSLIDPATDRFDALDEQDAERFRDRLDAFCRLYGFLSQIVPCNVELEKLYVYGKELAKKIREDHLGAPPVDLRESVALRYYQLAKVGDGAISLAADSGDSLRGPSSVGTGRIAAQQDTLSNLISRLNARFATEFDDAQDLVDGLGTRLLDDEQLRQAARNNDEDNFAHKFDPRLTDEMMARYAEFEPFLDKLFGDEEMLGFFRTYMRKRIYEQLRTT